ncbi:UDP-glucuronosyltransferase [Aphelenchoides fujianensis]|nr:UDP-glucuronosyltransferase [Aphelenchoides fujianensis]
MFLLRLFVSIFLLAFATNALKILVYSPKFGKSHMLFNGKLADLYARNGHEVVVLQPVSVDDDPSIANITGTKLARVIHRAKDFDVHYNHEHIQSNAWKSQSTQLKSVYSSMTKLSSLFAETCRHLLADEPLLEQLRAEKFDIGVSQFMEVCTFAIYRKIGITKYIITSAGPLPSFVSSRMGVPTMTSFVPDFFRTPPVRMTFWERVLNVFGTGATRFIFNWWLTGKTQAVIREHFPDFDLDEATNNASFVFVNADEYIEYARPTSSKIVHIGGFGIPEAGSLDSKLARIINESKRGVVLVSFGTLARAFTMPPDVKRAFLDSFAQFPNITFLFKYERPEDGIADDLPNVHAFEWLPQVEILHHPKALAFITHSGQNSITEATAAGVPMVNVDLFADQSRNARLMEERGLGIRMDKLQLTAEKLTAAIREVVDNPEYRERSRLVAEMMRTKPLNAEQLILRYTEFAHRFDVAQQLDMHGWRLNTIVFYNLDVYAALIAAAILLPIIFYFVLRSCIRLTLRCCRRSGGQKKKSE